MSDVQCSCDEIREMLAEIKALLVSEIGSIRRKRKPSAYNIFIGQCMKEGKNMKECALEYKKLKSEGTI